MTHGLLFRPPEDLAPEDLVAWVAGIDPGLDGAIVALRSPSQGGILCHKFPMPTVTITAAKGKGKSRREYDLRALLDLLSGQLIGTPQEGWLKHVFLEKQQAMAQARPMKCGGCGSVIRNVTPQGAVSTFSLGRGYGQIEGLLAGLRIPYTLVHPRTWQVALVAGLGGDPKARAAQVAQRLFPLVDLRRSERARKPDEGVIDALLLAEYGRRSLGGGQT